MRNFPIVFNLNDTFVVAKSAPPWNCWQVPVLAVAIAPPDWVINGIEPEGVPLCTLPSEPKVPVTANFTPPLNPSVVLPKAPGVPDVPNPPTANEQVTTLPTEVAVTGNPCIEWLFIAFTKLAVDSILLLPEGTNITLEELSLWPDTKPILLAIDDYLDEDAGCVNTKWVVRPLTTWLSTAVNDAEYWCFTASLAP